MGAAPLQLGLDVARGLAEGDIDQVWDWTQGHVGVPHRETSRCQLQTWGRLVIRHHVGPAEVAESGLRHSLALRGLWWAVWAVSVPQWDHWPSSSPSNLSMKNFQAPNCSIFISLFS